MFTAEEIEECDIFPKKLTWAIVIKFFIYLILMSCALIMMYSFYSGRDFTSIITMENLKYGTDTYYLKKIMQLVYSL
jgi:hypothetical protein